MHDNCCIRTVQEYICYKQTLNSEIIRHNTCVIMYSSVTAFEYEGISLGNSLLLIINNKKYSHDGKCGIPKGFPACGGGDESRLASNEGIPQGFPY